MVEYSERALRALRKTERVTHERIVDHLHNLGELDNPRSRGHGISGPKSALRRYRVGIWRIICSVDDGRLVILALDLGHRSTVYRAR